MQDKLTIPRWGLAIALCCLAPIAMADDELLDESQRAQKAQAELQARIDAADEATRQRLEELREARQETRRLDAYNDELEPLVERQAETIATRERALDTLAETRDVLPVVMRELVERLERFVESDLPFLRDERLARVADLETMLSDSELSQADKLDRILLAWRTELDYGREMDAWSGRLEGEVPLEVDFLRIGRVGLYYLTPDGRHGGVWKVAYGEWRPLDGEALSELRKGLRIARDQRAPELLSLPVSQVVEVVEEQGEEAS
ncbi:DUF3450 domain-containing protein [Litchfieldella qijiaojingensis]|uniref:DUF3450 domain-containing protein n=1 Tax=Litchfieldella qijiaojingensis TaxID=980347 RepID=A0ABQ2YGB6_9GAMM|nr:DUF3450 domain-containing protein [Halomonas qijiaojingensis]GGX81213.1 DUF3450 domain-containing protein [Halomonas qijiaojingensis]